MSNENFLDITELDFEGIKENFKSYLRSKGKFDGYDFEGAGLNLLMDILAYNTHYMGFYASMVGNEMFIDSATRRDSVVSHAKLLNYIPRSVTSASAVLTLQRTTSATINRGTTIVGSYVNESNQTVSRVFTFLEDYEYSQFGSNDWRVVDAEVYEGILQTLTYVYDSRFRERKFLVPPSADVSTIRVKIRQSAAAAEDDTEIWTRATDFTMTGEDQKVFFVQAAYDGQYEVYFGDGIIGKPLFDGNLVYIEYLNSSGEDGNHFTNFALSGAVVSTVSSARGGAPAEDLTEIRRNATRAFVAQNRSVTASDYESILLALYPQAESVKVWGGEENDPPQFGKVFVSVKPSGNLTVSELDKRFIRDGMREKAMVGIIPEVVDPEYLYAILSITTNFNPVKTSLSRNEVGAQQRNAVLSFFDTQLEKFDTPLYLSKLNKILDEVDPSILGTSVKTMVEQRIRPSTRYPTLVDLKFYNRVFHPYEGHSGSVKSSIFGYKNSVGEVLPCFIEDDGYGTLKVVTGEGGTKRTIVKEAGKIDYFSGNIVLFEFKAVNYGNSDHIKIRIQPESSDIFAMKNKIITIDRESIYMNIYTKEEVERMMRGSAADFAQALSAGGLMPEGPVLVSGGDVLRSVSPFQSPNTPITPPLPNSIPITLPTLGRSI